MLAGVVGQDEREPPDQERDRSGGANQGRLVSATDLAPRDPPRLVRLPTGCGSIVPTSFAWMSYAPRTSTRTTLPISARSLASGTARSAAAVSSAVSTTFDMGAVETLA